MLKILVPATSANLGAGFDCLGVALGLYNSVYIEEADQLCIESMDEAKIPAGKNNLIYRTLTDVLQMYGKPPRNYHIICENNIPMTRGLGSSSACIVAGILAANHLMGNPMDKQEMIDFACRLEGHPDNSTPAFLGGFVASVYQDGKVYCVKVPIGEKISFAAFVPNFALKTSVARKALPKRVDHKDAVFNLSRAALMSISILSGDYHNLSVAVEDRLHQPYRMGFIKDADKVFSVAKNCGALGTYLSGAGPTMIALVESKNHQFFTDAEKEAAQTLPDYQLLRLEGDDNGATIETITEGEKPKCH